MPVQRILTIGAFGTTSEGFFDALSGAGVDLLVDIRQRRGVRGAEYAFVNHKRLVAGLEDVGIAYLHEFALAPTTEIREAQYRVDAAEGVARRRRDHLSLEFTEAYRKSILDQCDLHAMVERWGTVGDSVCLFCVEREPAACHRSIVANAVAEIIGTQSEHLMPATSNP
jgi:uncharacterized protein (DUF488 family)